MHLQHLSGFGTTTKVNHVSLANGPAVSATANAIKAKMEKEPWFFGALPYAKLMIAVTVTGAPDLEWHKCFAYLGHETRYGYWRNEVSWLETAKVVLATVKEVFLPPVFPDWLIPVGVVNQATYRALIGAVWQDVLPSYNEPWESLLPKTAVATRQHEQEVREQQMLLEAKRAGALAIYEALKEAL